MTALCTSFARDFMALPTCSPQLAAPPIPRTGMVSGRFARSAFCAIIVSHSR